MGVSQTFRLGLAIALSLVPISTGMASLAAFSDAYHRCPGLACSDGVQSGMVYAIIFIVTFGSVFFLIKRKKRHDDLKEQ